MRTVKDYEPQIVDYLSRDRMGRERQWMEDGYFVDGERLFSLCGSDGCGCPTLIKSGNYEACSPVITEKIRGLDIPESKTEHPRSAPKDLTRAQLEAIADVQCDVWNFCHKD